MTLLQMEVEPVNQQPSQARKCRSGEDLGFISDVSLLDCKRLCLEQKFEESIYSNGQCVLVFNVFKRTLENMTEEECEELTRVVEDVMCDSVQYTPYADGAAGLCNLKYGRSGAVQACADHKTESYDFGCGNSVTIRSRK